MILPPVIGITMGDPAGIGPEIIVKALREKNTYKICRPVVIGDEGVIARAVDELKSTLTLRVVRGGIKGEKFEFGSITILDKGKIDIPPLSYGCPNYESSVVMAESIKEAVKLSLTGEIDAFTTAPINKEALRRSGNPYPGHTELIAKLANANNPVMMLAGDKLKVVLVTTHCSLKNVADLITTRKIFITIKTADDFLKRYLGIDRPKIAVAALNPHAGEEGNFGSEEETIIRPAIKEAVSLGINVKGPFPADSLFYYAAKGDYNLVVCMYHDQGLIPLKLLNFSDAVNVTLGLPIIRTSPDHGTAYDIAGKGIATPSSLLRAIELAARMAKVLKLSKL